MTILLEFAVENNGTLFTDSSKRCWSSDKLSAEKISSLSQNSQLGSSEQLEYSISTSETTSNSMADVCSLRMRLNSSTSGSCNGTPKSLIGGIRSINNGSRNSADLGRRCFIKEDVKLDFSEDTQDPFAFDEDEFELSKWDILSGKDKLDRTQKSGFRCRELEDGCLSQMMSQEEWRNGENQSQMIMSQQESNNGGKHNMHESPCSIVNNEEGSSLLFDCLLTAIKVSLEVNLTMYIKLFFIFYFFD